MTDEQVERERQPHAGKDVGRIEGDRDHADEAGETARLRDDERGLLCRRHGCRPAMV